MSSRETNNYRTGPVRRDENNPYMPSKSTRANSVITVAAPTKLGALQPVPDVSNIIEKRHELFQSMLIDLKTTPLHVSIEKSLTKLFTAKQCILWVSNQGMSNLTSPTLNKSIKSTIGIAGAAFRSKKLLNVSQPSKHESYNQMSDFAELASLYIPLFNDQDGQIYAIAQVTRDSDSLPFSDIDEESANFFANKFRQVSHLLIVDNNTITQISDNDLAPQVIDRLQHNFQCRDVQFWLHEKAKNSFSQYIGNEFVEQQNCGCVCSVMKSGVTCNAVDVTKLHGYSSEFDGIVSDPILIVPVQVKNQTFAIVLRGRVSGKSFSNIHAVQLENITPIVGRAILGSNALSSDETSSDFALRLKALLEVAENLSGVLDIDALIPTIMDRACSLLNTERCSLFLVDQTKQLLETTFHGGLDKSITLPITRGIVGHTATTGKIVNINDAYSDPRFDKQVDLETGFKTRTLLTVPIYNNRGEIAGVTEMINRRDGSAFDESDIKMMNAFNVFCGISLDNAKLYKTSLSLTRQLRGFAEMGSALNNSKTVKDVLEEILTNAKSVVHASRATIFLRDIDQDSITPYISVGDEIEHGTMFAAEVAKLLKPKVFVKDEIISMVRGDAPNLAKNSLESSSSTSRVTSLLSKNSMLNVTSSQKENDEFQPICGFPLLTSDSKVLGVMELKCNWKVLPEDLKLLDCFAVFAAVSLEKSQLEEIAKFGQIETALKKWISDDERKLYTIPEKLVIPEEKAACIYTVNFDAPQWDGIGLFKVLWNIMSFYDLFNEFKIPNEVFFTFVQSISQTYNKVPYHNWRHACDVTQFVNYEIITAKMDQVFTKFELLGIITSTICHDANHDGFTNVYNVKAETPLGILFKNQSVLETHHCSVAIGVITKEESNIFASLSASEYKAMWTLIIQLILITDMAKHFDFLKNLNAELDKGPADLENPEHRLMLMQAVLKCADISNVSRPFELADKWCDVLCEEFFRQGDLESANGMEYTSPLNDREHLDKPKSQIGFYTFVCLPLYKVAARAMPPLQKNVDQVMSNLAIWKASAAQKEQEAAQ
ncbi:3'5'-cyclic nucleotide phosphodiesterase family protein [Tritrichomonas foetus]|uniref:3'5'-cyclic nucleotide phosphodiesterase family protein n=1 Tax=Tritrichomonas foetus TaxID=1144522 RepID=A0A1J4KU36_9EUKA|nr:3'5'-cyclic nucleotide phosphodiesterase family protein [Tritrichomonas foetus]|eukprot:OHT13174.1 3'5'-cyclic nucleotide phosphodiesterase family protein [Tritrichomonas foetus]